MPKINKPHFILYGRSHCHLCDDMLVALKRLRSEHDFEVSVQDIDACPDKRESYDRLVPVLTLDDGEICHHFLDEVKVREVLSRFR